MMELPTPAPKNCEQEKWKAMVDSVIEFIAASRTMLCALNQRLQEGEKNQQELKKRTEDAKTKHPFYRDCVSSEKTPICRPKPDKTFPVSVTAAKEQPDKECQKNPEKLSTEIQACQTLDPPNESTQTPAQCPKHSKVKCKKLADAQENVLSPASPKTPMPSRIPRTKSVVVDKMGSGIFDKAPPEGGVDRGTKRTPKETTYTSLRQRSKTPKGDGSGVL